MFKFIICWFYIQLYHRRFCKDTYLFSFIASIYDIFLSVGVILILGLFERLRITLKKARASLQFVHSVGFSGPKSNELAATDTLLSLVCSKNSEMFHFVLIFLFLEKHLGNAKKRRNRLDYSKTL